MWNSIQSPISMLYSKNYLSINHVKNSNSFKCLLNRCKRFSFLSCLFSTNSYGSRPPYLKSFTTYTCYVYYNVIVAIANLLNIIKDLLFRCSVWFASIYLFSPLRLLWPTVDSEQCTVYSVYNIGGIHSKGQ